MEEITAAAGRAGAGTHSAPGDGVFVVFVRSWKPLAWRAVFALAFGLFAFLWPQMTLSGLVLLFAAYVLLDGIVAMMMGTRAAAREHSWAFLLEGFAGIGLGLAILLWTGRAATPIAQLIGFWAVATGILEIFAAMRLHRERRGELLIGVAGVASVLLGVALLAWPTAAVALLVQLLGAYAIVFGAAMLAQALRLHRLLRQLTGKTDGGPHAPSTPAQASPRA